MKCLSKSLFYKNIFNKAALIISTIWFPFSFELFPVSVKYLAYFQEIIKICENLALYSNSGENLLKAMLDFIFTITIVRLMKQRANQANDIFRAIRLCLYGLPWRYIQIYGLHSLQSSPAAFMRTTNINKKKKKIC